MTDVIKLKEYLQGAERKLTYWETGKISMTGLEHRELNKLIAKLKREINDNCKHEQVKVIKGHWVDSGYGCDVTHTSYDVRCEICEQVVLGCCDYGTGKAITGIISLEEAVDVYLKYLPHCRNDCEELLDRLNG